MTAPYLPRFQQENRPFFVKFSIIEYNYPCFEESMDMDRMSLFSSPLFLGFDHFERLVDTVSKVQNNYPPYNIEQVGEYGFRITLALAGFDRKNINISLENNQLTIKGFQEDDPGAVYIYRGIATRQFVKTFVLADGVEVKNASFSNGLLHINLVRIHNEKEVRSIEIDEPEIVSKIPDQSIQE